jgi:hypothetical protein
MRKLIATVFNYSLDGLLANEGTEFWKFCFDQVRLSFQTELTEPVSPSGGHLSPAPRQGFRTGSSPSEHSLFLGVEDAHRASVSPFRQIATAVPLDRCRRAATRSVGRT